MSENKYTVNVQNQEGNETKGVVVKFNPPSASPGNIEVTDSEILENLINRVEAAEGATLDPQTLQNAIDALNRYLKKDDTLDWYGTSSTASGTAAKTATLTGFIRRSGSHVVIKFTNENTANNPTLNVTSTGAAQIRYNGVNITEGMIPAGHLAILVFDGSYWQLLNPFDISALNSNMVKLHEGSVTVTTSNVGGAFTGNSPVSFPVGKFSEAPTIIAIFSTGTVASQRAQGTASSATSGTIFLQTSAAVANTTVYFTAIGI